MNLKLLSTALCRTPLFSYQDTLQDQWEALKKAVQISSEDFYALIKDVKSDELEHLPPKIKYACWKYFNRARFRSTPFGAFGSVSLVPLNNQEDTLILTGKPSLKNFVDWQQKDIFLKNTTEIYHKARFFLANTSFYTCGRQLRYISLTADNQFEISAIEKQEIIEFTLHLCHRALAKQQVIDRLIHHYQLDHTVIEDILIQLIAIQLLLTDLHPNIIGTDYFQRIQGMPKEHAFYALSTRQHLRGHLPINTLKVIPEAIQLIKDYLPQHQQAALQLFKQKFQQKFEYKEVPLLIALDPELGVGYNNLASSPQTDGLIETLKNAQIPDEITPHLPYTPLLQLLLNSAITREEINLERLKQHPKTQHPSPPLPNTFHALIQLSDEFVILEHAGGCTATGLLGRFTHADQAILEQCRSIANLEQTANPGCLFFDIAYQAEKKIDNINRRKAIYTYELPILSWPGSKETLSLQEILVSVRNDQILLRSKRYGKRLIPRLTTAYNYSRSDLSLYRFLCDLQHQGIQTSLNLHLKALLPGLDYYPRLTYKNLICSPQMWKVPTHLEQQDLTDSLRQLKDWLDAQNVSAYFKCGYHDQVLWFNRFSDEDLESFLLYCKGKKDLYLTEAFIPKVPPINDEYGKPYLAQQLISLYHSESIYQPINTKPIPFEQSNKSIVLPGQDWLYYEIYCDPSRSNHILTQLIRPYLKQMSKSIKQWFFIRYPIPDYHIRLRIQLRQQASLDLLISTFNQFIEDELRSGLIAAIQLKPYYRETERYGITEIETVEKCFAVESRYSLSIIQQALDSNNVYRLVIRLLTDLSTQLIFERSFWLAFIKQTADHFAQEHRFGIPSFKSINRAFLVFIQQSDQPLSTIMENHYQRTLQSIVNLLNGFEQAKQFQYIGDFIHMHVNRLFVVDQRMHEAIIYQYYLKWLLAEQKGSKHPI
ncbi:hypothetical protein GCM10023231_36380 [Olivibacter ginsenosidimutans]|uniref:Lantibiotic dehydratase n=1 Tax=Olivibacter ginsenosidimutans TaxID=1176537 RepID=A0ABP9C2W2_9SPHI